MNNSQLFILGAQPFFAGAMISSNLIGQVVCMMTGLVWLFIGISHKAKEPESKE